jgi:acetate kinase
MTTREVTAILTLNSGSSSLRIGLFSARLERVATGHVDRIGGAGSLTLRGADGALLALPDGVTADFSDHARSLATVIDALRALFPGLGIAAVGHRVVHGGPDHRGPIAIRGDALARLAAFEPFAPLHQPHNLAGIRAAIDAFPEAAVQVACFDTAFHRGHPFVHDTFALPRALYDKGVRRYGFHGLSYDYVAGALARDWPALAGVG